MLTRNFWKVLGAALARASGNTFSISVVDAFGATVSDQIWTASAPYAMLGGLIYPKSKSGIGYGQGTWFGTGTTPPTIDDYTLEAPIEDKSLTCTVGGIDSLLMLDGNDHFRLSVAYQITNTTDTKIVISEVGCYGALTAASKYFLVDRIVLETPVVIPANETVSVEYVIKFPYGT